MTSKPKNADKTPLAIIATAVIALAGNADWLKDRGADKTLVHGLIVQMQGDLKAGYTGRNDLLERQKAFEEHMDRRLDELEADILIDGKEDDLPPPPPHHFEPPEPLELPPANAKGDAPKVDQLLE